MRGRSGVDWFSSKTFRSNRTACALDVIIPHQTRRHRNGGFYLYFFFNFVFKRKSATTMMCNLLNYFDSLCGDDGMDHHYTKRLARCVREEYWKIESVVGGRVKTPLGYFYYAKAKTMSEFEWDGCVIYSVNAAINSWKKYFQYFTGKLKRMCAADWKRERPTEPQKGECIYMAEHFGAIYNNAHRTLSDESNMHCSLERVWSAYVVTQGRSGHDMGRTIYAQCVKLYI